MAIPIKNGKVTVNVVAKHRVSKLRNGHPFLIYSKALPARQAYLEFPEGAITLVTVKTGERNFTTLRVLTPDENQAVRAQFNLRELV